MRMYVTEIEQELWQLDDHVPDIKKEQKEALAHAIYNLNSIQVIMDLHEKVPLKLSEKKLLDFHLKDAQHYIDKANDAWAKYRGFNGSNYYTMMWERSLGQLLKFYPGFDYVEGRLEDVREKEKEYSGGDGTSGT